VRKNVKTTFDLPAPLLDQAKALAAKQNITVKELVISGLRKVIEESAKPDKPFKLPNASVKGRGLQQGIQRLSTAQLIAFSYERDNT
jgi:hypothetical protein